MISKLLLFFTLLGVGAFSFVNYSPSIVDCPSTVAPNSIFKATSNKSGDWLINGADYIVKGKSVFICSPASGDIEIIFSPGLIVKIVKVETKKVTSEFTKLIQSWAPKEGRKIVAASMLALGQGFTGENVEDLIKLTRLNNRALVGDQWKPFFIKLAGYCEENLKDSSLEEHKQLWIKVAKSLGEVS
jgi:hypothetical protein